MSGEPRPPSIFGSDDDWARYRRMRRDRLPAWHADRDYVTSVALEQLPRVCGQLGTGEAVAFLSRPRWWYQHGLTASELARHGFGGSPEGVVIALRNEPGSYDLIFIDRATGEWSVPNLAQSGFDLVSLAAWKWTLSDTKAAWRLARICGLRRPTA